MRRAVVYIHLVYWLGIIIDAIEAISAAIAHYSELFAGIATTRGFGVMTAWTVLLIWADRKPIERRIILLFTLIPIGATGLKSWILWSQELGSFQEHAVGLIGSLLLFVLYLMAYILARKIARE
jgi:hypothetical protein